MSLAFLTAAGGPAAPAALSPFDAATEADGAVFEVRDGWRTATSFGHPGAEGLACENAVGWADVSHLGKLEIQVSAGAADELAGLAGGLRLGHAVRHRDTWWCLLTPVRALLLCDLGALAGLRQELEANPALTVLDVTTQFAALRLAGPLARETFARFCALDLRPDHLPVGAFMPGSVARTPGFVLREAADQFVVLTGAALAIYFWSVVSDAGRRLGGRPVGVDALSAPAELEEAGTHA